MHANCVQRPIIFTFGVYDDIDIELSLATAWPDANILMFDPTPISAEFFPKKISEMMSVPRPGDCAIRLDSLHLFPIALTSSKDMPQSGKAVFFRKERKGRPDIFTLDQSFYKNENLPNITVVADTLAGLMSRFNVQRIDILKIDIEGSEPFIVDDIVAFPQDKMPSILYIDFDSGRFARVGSTARIRAVEAIRKLTSVGYIKCYDINWDILFFHVSAHHVMNRFTCSSKL
jgi:FkbM family methyltransferase